jgi:hypothetical protein
MSWPKAAMACQRIVSSSVQDWGRSERGPMSNARPGVPRLAAVCAGERALLACRCHRGDDVAGKIVASEQHLSGHPAAASTRS